MPGCHDHWPTRPVELGLHLCALLQEAQPKLCSCRKTAQVRMLMGKSAGAVSGGTIASLMGAMFDETPEELRLSADPYALNPPNAHGSGISSFQKRPADSFSCIHLLRSHT